MYDLLLNYYRIDGQIIRISRKIVSLMDLFSFSPVTRTGRRKRKRVKESANRPPFASVSGDERGGRDGLPTNSHTDISSELGVVAALLAADGELGDPEHEATIRIRHGFALEDSKHVDLAGDPGAGLERKAAGLDVRHEPRHPAAGDEAVGLERERHGDVPVPSAGYAARVDPGVPDVCPAVGEVGVPAAGEGEGGRVGVVDGEGQQERHVELQGERREVEPRGDAGEPGGDEAGGRVPDAEDGEEEDEDEDGEED